MDFICLCVLFSLIGYGLGFLFLNNVDINIFIQSKLAEFFKLKNFETKPILNVKDKLDYKIKDNDSLTTWKYQCKIAPWEKLKIDENLNLIISEFFETLMENYVHNW